MSEWDSGSDGVGLNKCDFAPHEILAFFWPPVSLCFHTIWQFALFWAPLPLTFKNVNNETPKEGQEKLVGAKTETLCADFGVVRVFLFKGVKPHLFNYRN